MDIEKEKRVLELARELENVNRQILRSVVEKGTVVSSLNEQYYSLRDELKELLSELPPITIRDIEVVKILRRVREGNYFYLDKKDKDISNFLNNLTPEQIEKLCKELNIDKETITSEPNWDLYEKFQIEMNEQIIPEEYYERKNDFSTIIISKSLPSKIDNYFNEIRQCYLFGNIYAAVGLCRALIEIVFRDKSKKYGLEKSSSSNVIAFEKRSVHSIIREVCSYINAKTLKEEAYELYDISSKILHGKDMIKTLEPLNFIRRTFKLIEQLYDLH